jgi:hypothetical protein
VIKGLLYISLLFGASSTCFAQEADPPVQVESPKKKAKKKAKKRPDRPRYQPMSNAAFGFRGVGEIWQESALLLVHRSSRFGGTGFFNADLTRLLGLEVELGYNRMKGKAVQAGTSTRTDEFTTLELVPISLDGTIRFMNERSELFLGVGAAFVNFNDRGPNGAISGVKMGIDSKIGIRIRTAFAQESLHPAARGVDRMDVELLLGRRQHQAFGMGQGLDLSAWRVGIGLVARL